MYKLIKFEKDNCNACELVDKFLKEKGVEYESINTFDNPEIAIKHKIRSMPRIIVFEEDKEKKRIVGYDETALNELNEVLK